MKNLFFTTLLLLFVFGSLKSQVYRYIPDSSFRNVLKLDYACPFDLSGDSLDISSLSVTSLRHLDCKYSYIQSLEGIQYFSTLNHLDCSHNAIDSISLLPSSLKYFNAAYNLLSSMPILPLGLDTLICNDNIIEVLPILPSFLKILDFTRNSVSVLPSVFPSALISLKFMSNRVDSISALPPQLNEFYCDGNFIRTIPTLPARLFNLSVSNNLLTSLPTLPDTLSTLDCSYNYITSLPTLPNRLYLANCSYNQLSSLPSFNPFLFMMICSHNHISSLPSMLTNPYILDCSNNDLTVLPALHTLINLQGIAIDSNNISVIPQLPNSLQYFSCSYVSADSLPPLPPNLISLTCMGNHLTEIPNLPATIEALNCSFNNLITLPNLPNVTSHYLDIDCSENPLLSCLPYLPASLNSLNFSGTAISCIPNIPSIYFSSIPSVASFPICMPSVDSCPSFVSILGKVFLDRNSNCFLDSMEEGISKIKVMLVRADHDSFNICSSVNGSYSSDTMSAGLYVNHIDTLELPFTVTCPISGYDSVLIDSLHMFDYDRNFGLECKPGFDIGTIGLVLNSVARPAGIARFNVHVGDMAKMYGITCTSSAGDIVLTYSGYLTYSSSSLGSLLPDSILPNRLVWKIVDFSMLDFYEAIKPEFYIDSSAISGDLLCFTTSVTPLTGDRVPTNNVFSQCFPVGASYDPNIKEVAPFGSVTTSQDWMYYTIHFQNTGTSYAENVFVHDMIDANLDLNSIQAVAASHNQFMQVYPDSRTVKFNFIHINLLDSSTNEQASHGYVQYRIKLKAGLSEGLNIQNTASILFDLNTPVVTNTTSTIICNTPSQVTQYIILGEGPTEVIVGLHHYSKTGIYTDILINSAGCDSVVKTIVDVFAGIDVVSPSRILFFPNPANTQVIIQLEGNSKLPLKIFDIYGRTIFSSDIMSNKYIVKTEFFQEGTYIIQCGNRHEKLVVKH
jgi:uncharacterized repeat protein (TIGR01451 family)